MYKRIWKVNERLVSCLSFNILSKKFKVFSKIDLVSINIYTSMCIYYISKYSTSKELDIQCP